MWWLLLGGVALWAFSRGRKGDGKLRCMIVDTSNISFPAGVDPGLMQTAVLEGAVLSYDPATSVMRLELADGRWIEMGQAVSAPPGMTIAEAFKKECEAGGHVMFKE